MTVTLGKATRMADGSVVQHQFTMGQRAGAAFDNITVTHLQDATEVRAHTPVLYCSWTTALHWNTRLVPYGS